MTLGLQLGWCRLANGFEVILGCESVPCNIGVCTGSWEQHLQDNKYNNLHFELRATVNACLKYYHDW